MNNQTALALATTLGSTPLTVALSRAARRTLKSSALDTLVQAAPIAARALVEIADNSDAMDRDRIAASKEILDRASVGTRAASESGSATLNISAQHLAAALAGIGLLAGFDIPNIGDAGDITDKVTALNDTMKWAEAASESLDPADSSDQSSAPKAPYGASDSVDSPISLASKPDTASRKS